MFGIQRFCYLQFVAENNNKKPPKTKPKQKVYFFSSQQVCQPVLTMMCLSNYSYKSDFKNIVNYNNFVWR